MSSPDPPPKRVARRRADTWGSLGASHPLPIDLVQKSVNRMGWVALVYALAIITVHMLGKWLRPEYPDTMPDFLFMDFNVPIAVFLGITMCALAWSAKLPPLLMLDLGLLFQVLAGLLLSLSENSAPGQSEDPFPGASSVSVWLALYVLAVPTTLGKTIVAALATAAMVPLGLGVNLMIQGEPSPPIGYWVLRSFSPLFIALSAILLSRFVYDLGRQVRQEREMGAYQLEEVLGSGGMGEVWRAKHRMLAREAAIKLIPPKMMAALTDEQIKTLTRRFEREATATAALRSPHTITLYDYGVSEDQSFYYAMEKLDGMDLWYLIEEFGPVSAPRAVHYLRDACDSLAEAHAAGIVHRDIKPTNLFTCRLGCNFDFLKVLDFGLVKFALDSATTQLTAQGIATGTPAYMAPECGADSRKVDARSDIYSLGCVAYWLLTGKLVFDEEGAFATVLAHVNKTPVPPSQRTEREIPPGLEAVIMQCLEKEPERRPQSALELDTLLAKCDAGEQWTPGQARSWWETNLPQFCQVPPAKSA